MGTRGCRHTLFIWGALRPAPLPESPRPAAPPERDALHRGGDRPACFGREAVRLRQPRQSRRTDRDGAGGHPPPEGHRRHHRHHGLCQHRLRRAALPRGGIGRHSRLQPRAHHQGRRGECTQPANCLPLQRHRGRQPLHRRHQRPSVQYVAMPLRQTERPRGAHPRTHRPGHRRLLEHGHQRPTLRALRRAARQRRPLLIRTDAAARRRRLPSAAGCHGGGQLPHLQLPAGDAAPRTHRPP